MNSLSEDLQETYQRPERVFAVSQEKYRSGTQVSVSEMSKETERLKTGRQDLDNVILTWAPKIDPEINVKELNDRGKVFFDFRKKNLSQADERLFTRLRRDLISLTKKWDQLSKDLSLTQTPLAESSTAQLPDTATLAPSRECDLQGAVEQISSVPSQVPASNQTQQADRVLGEHQHPFPYANPATVETHSQLSRLDSGGEQALPTRSESPAEKLYNDLQERNNNSAVRSTLGRSIM
jgi:hypothetical protein